MQDMTSEWYFLPKEFRGGRYRIQIRQQEDGKWKQRFLYVDGTKSEWCGSYGPNSGSGIVWNPSV